MRETQPRLLVIWGKYDLSFDPGEPERYRKDVSKAEVHVLDVGHFALDRQPPMKSQHSSRSSLILQAWRNRRHDVRSELRVAD